VTICGAVSPAGGSFEEPVTQATLSVVGAFLGLSRERSDARRYPAIDPHISWTKYIDAVSKEIEKKVPGWGDMVKKAHKILSTGREIGKRMEVVGEEGTAIDDMVIYLKGELYDFSYLQQNAFDKQDAYCPLSRQYGLFLLINRIFDKQFKFNSHDEARDFFLNLQIQIKNMNFMELNSPPYQQAHAKIDELIETAKAAE
jgi:V/A-type H+-transporting ATPase subunit A